MSITSNAVPYVFVNLVLCVARWGQNTGGVCFIWTSFGAYGEKMLLICARFVVPQCLETCSVNVFDGMRLGAGRKVKYFQCVCRR